MKTLFYIIRHGQSVGNKKRIYLGHTDLELTELGENQAEAVAEMMKAQGFGNIRTELDFGGTQRAIIGTMLDK